MKTRGYSAKLLGAAARAGAQESGMATNVDYSTFAHCHNLAPQFFGAMHPDPKDPATLDQPLTYEELREEAAGLQRYAACARDPAFLARHACSEEAKSILLDLAAIWDGMAE